MDTYIKKVNISLVKCCGRGRFRDEPPPFLFFLITDENVIKHLT